MRRIDLHNLTGVAWAESHQNIMKPVTKKEEETPAAAISSAHCQWNDIRNRPPTSCNPEAVFWGHPSVPAAAHIS